MDRTNDIDAVRSYISSSKYRLHVLRYLFEEGQATPTEISEAVDDLRPHVSRALSELQEKGVVELRVPEARTVGRYYGLTDAGVEVWPTIRHKTRNVEWSIEEPANQATQAIVELARETLGESLRSVCLYDEDDITVVFADPDVRSQYSDAEAEQAFRSLLIDHSLEELDMPDQECWSETIQFTDFSVLKVRVEDDTNFFISFTNTRNVSLPEFADAVLSAFLDASS
ncbi:winged helix-turn-helix domain-containing protein [Halobellus rarus]|uniref:Winged helix-turn-helix domain-containing protein n=1 Tax=Halobellus rarus TaxID=1126237 RepID=A0ABD6CQ85_9EURY|nr:winged helix-turn-helix domain-containing protein [Halobellus rarus]